MTTLLDLIQSTPSLDILRECERIDENNGMAAYEPVLRKLTAMEPKTPDFTIVLSPWENGDGIFHEVSGVVEGEPDSYGLDLTPWNEWIGAEVRVSNLDLTPAQIVAQCLNEMTFYAFDEAMIQEFREELHRRVDEIEAEHGKG